MDFVAVIIAVGSVSILSFFLGLKASAIASGRKTNLNPVTAIREKKARNESKERATREEIMMRNIDNYNGTSKNQIDLPRRNER